MSQPTHETSALKQRHEMAPTRFVEANGIQFAYRRFGRGEGIPLLFCQHFTGTMDNWDPIITNTLTQRREVMLFDNRGIESSAGQTPDSVQAMATAALASVDALGLKQIDLLGFSLGGMVAQQMVLDRPELVRHLILAGTGPEGGEGIDIGGFPRSSAVLADASLSHFDRQQGLFFAPTETSQAAGRAFSERKSWRKDDRDPEASPAVAKAQTAAIKSWGQQKKGERYGRLKEIKQPTLVFNGIDDVMIPTVNSYILTRHTPDARLVLYPDSGHGALFQYSDQFCADVNALLVKTVNLTTIDADASALRADQAAAER
jgi:pimeloyl-ACP methyl ester carboxylesterase